MKKLFALMLALVLLCSTVSAMAAVDMSFVQQHSNMYNIDVDADRGVAFINVDPFLSVKDRSFEHKYESTQYYSYVYSDIIVVNYQRDDAYPVLRFWVEYRGTKAINGQSVTLIFDGKSYTFSNVYDSDNVFTKDNGEPAQTMMLKIGSSNLDFIVALENYYNSITAGESSAYDAVVNKADVRMIIHGSNDEIEVPLSPTFMLEFFLMKTALIEVSTDLSSDMDRVHDATPLTVR